MTIIEYVRCSIAMRILVLIVLYCATQNDVFGQVIKEQNDPRKHPTLINKTVIQQLNGKPIEYYLNHKDIGETAKLFYKGEYAIYDEEGTFSIIDSVLTDNAETRFFYFFVFNEMLNISDGAVSEYISPVCVKYVRKFPCEFLRYSSDMIYELNLNKWTSFISFDLGDKTNYDEFARKLDKDIKMECFSLTTQWNEIRMKVQKHLPR
jgi:hypothetical protein